MTVTGHSRMSLGFGPFRVEKLLRYLVNQAVPDLAIGRLVVQLPGGELVCRGKAGAQPEMTIEIKRWRAMWKLAFGGEIGFAQSYINGDWLVGDLRMLFHLIMANETAFRPVTSSYWTLRGFRRLRHFLNRNTRRGSRRNICAHYDLGNEFYAAWLDRDMNYSSALYGPTTTTLEEAQSAKLDRIVALLAPRAGEALLEIGCGWGSLAERLHQQGCKVTGITLSPAQAAYARQRLANAIAGKMVEIRLQDYRDVTGSFDHIVSIEMIEAVGEAFWPIFFERLRDRLKPGGTVVLQAITICESRFEDYRSCTDFIQRYVFPGGMLPTASLIRLHARRVGLDVVEHLSLGESYACTLSEWRCRFHHAWPKLAAMGFNEPFRRLWDYYLAYCEIGFRVKTTDVGLFKLRYGAQEKSE